VVHTLICKVVQIQNKGALAGAGRIEKMASVYEIVTEKILAELASGNIPWEKPWQIEAPKSLVSGKPYRGVNCMLLGMAGFASPYWLTYKQAADRGGNVRKGEHGTLIVFWKWLDNPTNRDA
jgi:antirestriction protein ArdC